jgi:hypothetical protein
MAAACVCAGAGAGEAVDVDAGALSMVRMISLVVAVEGIRRDHTRVEEEVHILLEDLSILAREVLFEIIMTWMRLRTVLV